MYSSGKFDVEFDYTLLEKENNYNHYERLIIWKYEKLGISPDAKRESDVELIKEYINTKNEFYLIQQKRKHLISKYTPRVRSQI